MPILAELRARTRAHHERLESHLDLERRCRTLTSYGALLRRFYGFYAPTEARIALCDEARRFDAERRRKVPLLERDLETLLGPSAAASASLCDDLPALDSLPQVAGCLYVMEGATLGGQIIGRYLKQTLGLDAQNGAAFFHSYGAQVGPMWKSFGRVLEDCATDAPAQEGIVDSAAATFEMLERWLCASSTPWDV